MDPLNTNYKPLLGQPRSNRPVTPEVQADWLRRYKAWEAGGKVGPAPVEPLQTPGGAAVLEARRAGFEPNLRNSAAMHELTRAGANSAVMSNPYQQQIADRSRAAQMALINQMRAQQAGPSLAAMQGQGALGQSGQMALGSAAMGVGQGRGAMLGARNAGVGIAGDTGQGRLAEVMKSQASLGGAAGSLRGQDLRSAEARQQAGLGALGLTVGKRLGYAGAGTRLTELERLNNLELYKLIERANKAQIDRQLGAISGVAGMAGPIFGSSVQGAVKANE